MSLHFLGKCYSSLKARSVAVQNRLVRFSKGLKLQKNLRDTDQKLFVLRKSLKPGQKITAILLTEHFGDIVACEPVIRSLRSKYRDDAIVWFTFKPFVELLVNHPDLAAVYPVTCLTECKIIAKKKLLDRVVDLHLGPRMCAWFGDWLYEDKSGSGINAYNHYFHGSIVEAFSVAAGLERISEAPRFHIPSSVQNSLLSKFVPERDYLVIHASSNSLAKEWDDGKWVTLSKNLIQRYGVRVVEVGLQPRVGNHNPAVVDLCGKLSLLELAEVIRRAAFFIGIDSGPAHFANALRCPALILLGHFHCYKSYMPYNGFFRENENQMILAWDGPAKDIPLDSVETRLQVTLDLKKIFGPRGD